MKRITAGNTSGTFIHMISRRTAPVSSCKEASFQDDKFELRYAFNERRYRHFILSRSNRNDL